MKVILGLGNPGKEYENTRHNVGWWLLDHLADRWGFDGWKKDGQAKVVQGHLPGVKEPVRLVKPQTYMNLSGGVLVQYAGDCGHINADSGLASWPEGHVLLQDLMKD